MPYSEKISSTKISTADSIDEQIKIEDVLSSDRLPTIPAVAIRLLELTNNPQTEIREIVKTVKSDPAICAKILKSTNSSFFGFSSKITSINRAVPLLGKSVVTALALSFSLHEGSANGGSLQAPFHEYWKRSLVQASAAEVLRTKDEGDSACEHFLAGLLLDLGQLALLNAIPEIYVDLLNKAYDERLPLHEIEQEKLGFDHIEVGTRLMTNWRLPKTLIEAVEFHHVSDKDTLDFTKDDLSIVTVSRIASVVGDYFIDSQKAKSLDNLKNLTEYIYGFSSESLDNYLEKVHVRIREAGDLLNHNTDEILNPMELMALANEQLAKLVVTQQVACTKAKIQSETSEEEVTKLESTNAQLQEKALFDSLTKLYNRTFFEEAYKNEVAHSVRCASPLGVIFFDLDHFKNINDSYGHIFGDEVLSKIGDVMRETVRKSDIVARHGGEEFIVLMSHPTRIGIERFSERIRQNIEQADFLFQGKRIVVTVSVGAAITIPNPKEVNLEELLVRVADEAMYDSKNSGRNRVTVKSLIDDFEDNLTKLARSKQYSRWLVARKILDIATVSRAILQSRHRPHKRLGELGIELGFLDLVQIQTIRTEQGVNNLRFGRTAIKLGILSLEEVSLLLSLQIENPDDLNDALVGMQSISRKEADSLAELYFSEIPTRPEVSNGI